jgi:hypothetical protein
MKSRRKLLIGAACILALGAAPSFEPATAISSGPTPAAAPEKPRHAKNEAATAAPATGTAEAHTVRASGELSPEHSGESSRMSAQASRDLFAGRTWKVAPPPPAPVSAPKPVAPPFPYVYSGSMRDASDPAATGAVLLFIKAGNRNFIVRKGETVGAAYRLDDITEREAVFTYLPLQEKQSLAIGNTH